EEMYRKVMRSNPVLFPAYFPKTAAYSHIDHILFGGADNAETGGYLNPYADMVRGYQDNSRSLIMAQFEVDQDFSFLTEGLSLRAMANTKRLSYFALTRGYQPFYYQASAYDPTTGDPALQLLNERAGGGYPQGEEYLSFDPGDKTV